MISNFKVWPIVHVLPFCTFMSPCDVPKVTLGIIQSQPSNIANSKFLIECHTIFGSKSHLAGLNILLCDASEDIVDLFVSQFSRFRVEVDSLCFHQQFHWLAL